VFASTELAQRIEAAESRLTLGVGRRVASRREGVWVNELGGGAAVSSAEGSPFDKVVGIGFEALDWLAFDDFTARALTDDRKVQVELSTLADASIARKLSARDFLLVGHENVLGVNPAAAHFADRPSEVRVAQATAEEEATWIDLVTTGFLQPDTPAGSAPHESFARESLERTFRDLVDETSFVRVLARRGDELAGGASFRRDGTLAQLTGAATLPAHRRRGVQTALLRARLELAARSGCELAVVTTAPGSKSQQNVMAVGFALLYCRAILVKSPRVR
jgi:GNAT superfamily N-acetyltransferase